MRIASNRVDHMVDFYRGELKGIYSESEIHEIVYQVFEHFLHYSRTDLLISGNENINQSDLISIYDACKRLKTGEPLQYVLGECYFYNYKFRVNKNVLIPRPETEELVELIFESNKGKRLKILDIGTGSGCIPITLKQLMPDCEVKGCDISNEALHVAKENAHLNRLEVDFFIADALNLNLNDEFDIIISNPPYIKKSESSQMANNVLNFEPHQALFVNGDDDIVFYRKIKTERH